MSHGLIEQNCFLGESYIQNNLAYREVTSDVIIDFKIAQKAVMNQLQMNNSHQFSKTAKEVLLLKYSVWFNFLLKLELVLLTTKPEERRERIGALLNERSRCYKDTIKRNPKIFDQEWFEIWDIVHQHLFDYLTITHQILDVNDKCKYYRSFGKLLIKVLSQTLFEAFEVDVILNKDKDYIHLHLNSLDFSYKEATGKSLLVTRMKYYEKIKKVNKVILSSYIDSGLVPVEATDIYQYLKEKGYEIEIR